jgi:hypothetical protein
VSVTSLHGHGVVVEVRSFLFVLVVDFRFVGTTEHLDTGALQAK